MNIATYSILFLLSAGAAPGVSDVTVLETNAIRVEVIRPEKREHFRIDDELLLLVDNALFETNSVFLPEEREVLLEVTCTTQNGKTIPRTLRYKRLGEWYSDIPLQVSPKRIHYTISTGAKRQVFRAGSRDITTRPVHGRQASKEIFRPSEVFEFPPGDEFLMKLRVQLIMQRGQGAKFEVIKFPYFEIHLRSSKESGSGFKNHFARKRRVMRAQAM